MLLDTLKALCPLFGPSGLEDEVRSYIRKEAEPYADQILETRTGALLVFKRGRVKPKFTVMLAAHMDEVGVIVKEIDGDGFLRFGCVGGIDRRVLLGKPVFLGPRRIPGVIGMKPVHLTTEEERKSVPKIKELYIDVGAANQKEAEALVEPGDYGCFDPAFLELQNGFVCSKAIDDRLGCALMLEKLKEDLPVDAWFAFTVQEEIGSRGAFGAAFGIRPDVVLVLEATSAADIPPNKEANQVCAPRRGPVISLLDKGTVYDAGLFRLLTGIAEEKGIPWQVKTRRVGSTDARAAIAAAGGCRAAGLSAPVRCIHSPSCVGSVRDFEDMKRMLDAFLEKMEDYHG